ncbi:hypothetical protein KBY29_08540 [Ruegeria pomeroyi]|nr:hypothetical protein [Ruegeria pomeroyi]
MKTSKIRSLLPFLAVQCLSVFVAGAAVAGQVFDCDFTGHGFANDRSFVPQRVILDIQPDLARSTVIDPIIAHVHGKPIRAEVIKQGKRWRASWTIDRVPTTGTTDLGITFVMRVRAETGKASLRLWFRGYDDDVTATGQCKIE